MLAEALSGEAGRVRQFRRDGWAKPWTAGGAKFTYLVLHDAHHGGQLCMLAHQILAAGQGQLRAVDVGKTLEGVRIQMSALASRQGAKSHGVLDSPAFL